MTYTNYNVKLLQAMGYRVVVEGETQVSRSKINGKEVTRTKQIDRDLGRHAFANLRKQEIDEILGKLPAGVNPFTGEIVIKPQREIKETKEKVSKLPFSGTVLHKFEVDTDPRLSLLSLTGGSIVADWSRRGQIAIASSNLLTVCSDQTKDDPVKRTSEHRYTDLEFNNEGSQLALGFDSGGVDIWEISTDKIVNHVMSDPDAEFSASIAYMSPQTLLVGYDGEGAAIGVYDQRTDDMEGQFYGQNLTGVTSMQLKIAQDGVHFICLYDKHERKDQKLTMSNEVMLFDIRNCLVPLKTFKSQGTIRADWNSTSNLLAMSSSSAQSSAITLFDVSRGTTKTAVSTPCYTKQLLWYRNNVTSLQSDRLVCYRGDTLNNAEETDSDDLDLRPKKSGENPLMASMPVKDGVNIMFSPTKQSRIAKVGTETVTVSATTASKTSMDKEIR